MNAYLAKLSFLHQLIYFPFWQYNIIKGSVLSLTADVFRIFRSGESDSNDSYVQFLLFCLPLIFTLDYVSAFASAF